MLLEIFAKTDYRVIGKKADINGESAEFLWGWKIIRGSSTNFEFIYEGARLSVTEHSLRQILSGLKYPESSSVLYMSPKQVINHEKTAILYDFRYFPFGSVEFFKQFHFRLSKNFLEGSTTANELESIYQKIIGTTNKMLKDVSKYEWKSDTPIPSELLNSMKQHIVEFSSDTLVARITNEVRESIYH